MTSGGVGLCKTATQALQRAVGKRGGAGFNSAYNAGEGEGPTTRQGQTDHGPACDTRRVSESLKRRVQSSSSANIASSTQDDSEVETRRRQRKARRRRCIAYYDKNITTCYMNYTAYLSGEQVQPFYCDARLPLPNSTGETE
jgi:hypothetical protein